MNEIYTLKVKMITGDASETDWLVLHTSSKHNMIAAAGHALMEMRGVAAIRIEDELGGVLLLANGPARD